MNVIMIDSGGYNTGSVLAALARLGIGARLSNDAALIRAASHVILPGVGAAAQAMRKLHAARLTGVISRLTQPVLGICLGMQLLYEQSDEGDTPCLGIFPGRIQKLGNSPQLPAGAEREEDEDTHQPDRGTHDPSGNKWDTHNPSAHDPSEVPEWDTHHPGIWPSRTLKPGRSPELRIPHMGWNRLQWRRQCDLRQALPEPAWMYFVHSYAAPVTGDTLASADHGQPFTALARRKNFLAAQFHPERSAAAGAALLEYFFSL